MVSKKKNNTFVAEFGVDYKFVFVVHAHFQGTYRVGCLRKGARVVEEARLESVYTSKAYQGFESPSFREIKNWKQLNNSIN